MSPKILPATVSPPLSAPPPFLTPRNYIPPHVYKHPAAILLELCTSTKELHQFLPLVIKNGLYSEHLFQTKMVSLFCKFGSLNDALKVFESIESKTGPIYYTLLKGYAQQDTVNNAYKFFCRMKCDSVAPVVYNFTYLLKACADRYDAKMGDVFTEEQNELVESAAEMLYGLIHVRYILTSKGMAAMLEKYKNYDFGRCPRVYCCGQPCLPVGQSDIQHSSTVKIYCPKCEDIYYPRSKYQGNIDGAYFGTTFPHLFLMTYGHLKPQKPTQSYTQRVFGFKLHKP
ncbi:Casein kinase II subunit beta [Forsythia ovata]|uniref:Casein kinase II subunit beta n=1 Tax=Forsythia ovata TaxID=205694 RepID=A0ABD1QQ74_9LAMI